MEFPLDTSVVPKLNSPPIDIPTPQVFLQPLKKTSFQARPLGNL